MVTFDRFAASGQRRVFFLLLLAFNFNWINGEVYTSCRDIMIRMGAGAVDGVYQIMISDGHAINLYCHGFNTGNPVEFLTLPAGKNRNFASVYTFNSVPYACHRKKDNSIYAESGRTEFAKVAFALGARSIIVNNFTFATTRGLKNISYGHAGDMFCPLKTCYPYGSFKIDLMGTPFMIRDNVQWYWDGNFQDGSGNGTVRLYKKESLGCYKDSNRRAMPMARMTSKSMTIDLCIKHCHDKGYYYAGAEYAVECWCGNKYDTLGISKNCNMRCKGNTHQYCGGSMALSVYTTGTDNYRSGRCGGYPGRCFPAQYDGMETKLLFLKFNPNHPCVKKICAPFGTCIATSSTGYMCKCPTGMSGGRCERRSELLAKSNQCPDGYQPEDCRCQTNNCKGAMLMNGYCYANKGKPKLMCRYGNPLTVSVIEVTSERDKYTVSCPAGSKMTSCTYWDNDFKRKGNGVLGFRSSSNICRAASCKRCSVHAVCIQYFCGCKNGGICDIASNTCKCRPGYKGALCEVYDYCSYWEIAHKKAACSEGGGVCRSVQQVIVSATGGDAAGSVCTFPFTIQGQTFSRCVASNDIGPPYACGASFNGMGTYIGLGEWSPGPIYTIAAWVKPTVTDSVNRLVVGGINNCQDVGIGYQYGKFQTYYKEMDSPATCTVALSPRYNHSVPNQWHSVAVINNGKIITLVIDGSIAARIRTRPNFLGSSTGFWIGGGPCCNSTGFKGMIKNVKVWNQALSLTTVLASFSNNNVNDSLDQVVTNGLVAHYELGDPPKLACNGIDHNFNDWIPTHYSQISGHHCNIERFIVAKHTKVYISHWNGTDHGFLEVDAQSISIQGELNANGAGYRGGASSIHIGADGTQGESYTKMGIESVQPNAGGGGGGLGESKMKVGGRPGGGGSHGTVGRNGTSKTTKFNGTGICGHTYGHTDKNHQLYMGSGGGSGGNALDVKQTPPGGAGGNGGGSITLIAQTRVLVTGFITVQGGNGVGDPSSSGCYTCPSSCKSRATCGSIESNSCWDKSGPGGGGSGGSIYLAGEYVNIGKHKVDARGGRSGQGAYMCGGNGGLGRIHVESSLLYGTLDNYYGVFTNSSRQDKFKDFSNIGRTVTGSTKLTNENAVYIGCYKETPENLLKEKLDLSDISVVSLTPVYCHKMCSKRNFKYSGTKGGTECYCDNHIDHSNRVDDSQCTTSCAGDSGQNCGGVNTLLVFGLKPQIDGQGFNGVTDTCKPWCVTADRTTKSPKWGECVDEEETLSMNITCDCPAGKMGIQCLEDCPDNKWGINCENNCTCSKNSSCNANDGDCQCQKGWKGANCEIKSCPLGVSGADCDYCRRWRRYGPLCKACNCSNSPCDRQTGQCLCNYGVMGEICEKVCSPGKWGPDCRFNCSCMHSNSCQPVHGFCTCPPGYFGYRCQNPCASGVYGLRCAISCPTCNKGTCHHVTGQCICDAGITGTDCTEYCPSNTWGIGCAETCGCNKGCNPMEGICCQEVCPSSTICSINGTCLGIISIKTTIIPMTGLPTSSPLRSTSPAISQGGIAGIVLAFLILIILGVGVFLYLKRRTLSFKIGPIKYETQEDEVNMPPVFGDDFLAGIDAAATIEGDKTEKK